MTRACKQRNQATGRQINGLYLRCLGEAEYDEKRGQLIITRDKIIKVEVNNNADDNLMKDD